ncbi:hypothetical protein V2J09_010419 [Rumex salicifolius]
MKEKKSDENMRILVKLCYHTLYLLPAPPREVHYFNEANHFSNLCHSTLFHSNSSEEDKDLNLSRFTGTAKFKLLLQELLAFVFLLGLIYPDQIGYL